MHSSLAVTTCGTPLGLAAVKFWTRSKYKGTAAIKSHVNPTRVSIETKESYRWLENLRQSIALLGSPERCVHVGDRESDIYEFFCLVQDIGTRFLVCVQTNRLAEHPVEIEQSLVTHRVFIQLASVPWSGFHQIMTSDDVNETVTLQIKFCSVKTLPPIGKQKRYAPQTLYYIHTLEIDPPEDREPIGWKLVTNLPVNDLADAIEKLNWYAMR